MAVKTHHYETQNDLDELKGFIVDDELEEFRLMNRLTKKRKTTNSLKTNMIAKTKMNFTMTTTTSHVMKRIKKPHKNSKPKLTKKDKNVFILFNQPKIKK